MNIFKLFVCAGFMSFMAIATYGAEGSWVGARPYACAAFILISIALAQE